MQYTWTRGIWFFLATPKYAFVTWLAMLDRLSSMDRISKWSQRVDATCVLCKNDTESRNHLFFECSYSSQLWEHLISGILRSSFSNNWSVIVRVITSSGYDKKSLFCIRYAFQAAVYAIWRERNHIHHGEKPLPMSILKKLTDKGIRNKLNLLSTRRGSGMDCALQFWFQTKV